MTRVVITGTPGTGKTTVSENVASELGLDVVHLADLYDDFADGYDEERDTTVVDVDGLRRRLEGEDDVVIEGHLSHHLDADVAVVLRCRPDVLRNRLERRYREAKAGENAGAEALDVVLSEALDSHDTVYEVDTTSKDPDETVEEVVDGVRDRENRVGVVDWSGFVEEEWS